MSRVNSTSGVIRNSRDASVAVLFAAIIAASALHATIQPVRLTSPWVFERLYGLSQVSRPFLIGLSLFFWAFVLWILFWFYKAAREKYERLLMASFAVGFVLSVIKHFVSPHVAAKVQFLSTAAALVSLVAAIALLFTLRQETTTPR